MRRLGPAGGQAFRSPFLLVLGVALEILRAGVAMRRPAEALVVCCPHASRRPENCEVEGPVGRASGRADGRSAGRSDGRSDRQTFGRADGRSHRRTVGRTVGRAGARAVGRSVGSGGQTARMVGRTVGRASDGRAFGWTVGGRAGGWLGLAEIPLPRQDSAAALVKTPSRTPRSARIMIGIALSRPVSAEIIGLQVAEQLLAARAYLGDPAGLRSCPAVAKSLSNSATVVEPLRREPRFGPRTRPIFVECGMCLPDVGQVWPKFDNLRPELADLGGNTWPILADVTLSKFGAAWAHIGQLWPKPPNVGRSLSTFGPAWRTSGKHMPNSADVARVWADSRLFEQSFDNRCTIVGSVSPTPLTNPVIRTP